jgi:hypothetical protein
MFEKTIANDNGVRLAGQFYLLSGIDGAQVPQLLGVDSANSLKVSCYANARIMKTCGNASIVTNAVDVNFTPLTHVGAFKIIFFNDTGVTLEVLQDGTGVALPVLAGTVQSFEGLISADQLSVRRATGNGVVTVKYRWEGPATYQIYPPHGYMLDNLGNLILDSNGNPIPT